MTKRAILKASSFITLFIFAIMMFITWSIKTDLETASHIYTAEGELTLDTAFVIFASATAFLALTFFFKRVAAKHEKNRLTLIVILLDVASIAFFVMAFSEAIPLIIAGQIMEYIFEAAALVLSAFALLLDLISLPAMRWG